jgi:tetratricopeptide (TPR) repeat protein
LVASPGLNRLGDCVAWRGFCTEKAFTAMDIRNSDGVSPEGDAESAVADCLADLSNNAPADVVLARLRSIEPQAAGSPRLHARFLRARAIASNRLGFPTEALGDLLEARNILQHEPDQRELTEIIRTIAIVHSWRGEGREAALALLQAVAVASSQPADLAVVLMEAGRLNMEIGRPHDAASLFSHALEMATPDLPRRECERARVNLVQALVAAGRIEEAHTHLESVLPSLAPESRRLRLILHIEAMRIAIARSDWPMAHEALARAAEFVGPGANSFSRVELAHAEAELVLAEGDAAKAEKLLLGIIARYADAADDLAPREITARLLQARALDALHRPDEGDRTLAAALRRALARGLIGYADLVRGRIAARGGSEGAWFPDTTIIGRAADPAARFVRRRRLGTGGYGSVDRAYDLELGVEVAIKQISLEGVYDVSERPRLLDSARTEVAAASRIQHPGIVRVYGMLLGANDDALIIEELVEGPTLRSIMDKPMAVARALDLVARLAFALAAVHAAGVIHRDVKPENIILRGESSPVLVDFGVAIVGSRRTRAQPAGTRNYMSPEQVRGHQLDGRSDLYALGVIAHELLLGRLPNLPRMHLLTMGRARHYDAALKELEVERDTSELLTKLLEPLRWRRPQSAANVGAQLTRSAAFALRKAKVT